MIDVLVCISVLASLLYLFRHLLPRMSTDWRSLAGFVCGAILGLVFCRVYAGDAVELVRATGLPWPVFKVLFVLTGGVLAAGPVRKFLEEAFPSGPKRKNENADV